jgi:hypothetical protein
MASRNPFLSSSTGDGDDTGGAGSNPFLRSSRASSTYRKKQEEDAQLNAEKIKAAADKAAQTTQNNKPALVKLRDVIGNVGNFIKDSAVDLKDTTVDTAKGLTTAIESPFKQRAASQASDQALKLTQEFSKKTANWTPEDYQKNHQMIKDHQAQVDALNGKAQKIQASDKIGDINTKKLAFESAESVINIGTLGTGTAIKQVGKSLTKQAVKQIVKTGGMDALREAIEITGKNVAKKGAEETVKSGGRKLAETVGKDALIGGGFGVTSTGASNPDASAADLVKGAATGATIGGAIPVVGAGLKFGAKKVLDVLKDHRLAKDAAEVAGNKATKVDTAGGNTADDVNAIMNQAIEEQQGKYSKGVVQRVKNFIGDQYNPFRALAKVDDAYARSKGLKLADLPADERLEHAADRALNSDKQFAEQLTEKTRTGDSAEDLIKKYGEGTDESMEFNNYTNAKFDQEFREKHGGKRIQQGLTDEQLDKFTKNYESRNKDALKDLGTKKAINDKAVDNIAEAGIITKEEAETIKNSYKHAVPLERIMPDDLERPAVGGKSLGSIGKQTVVQKLEGGSDIPLSNSFETLINRVAKSVSQANRAKLAKLYLERVEGGVARGDLTVGAGNKTARMAARKQAQAINEGVRYLKKKVSVSNRQANRLQSELDKLNRQGLDVSLGTTKQELRREPVKTVTVKTVGPLIKDNAPKTLDDLSQSYNVKAALLKEYGPGAKGIDQMAADIHNGGWNQLMELNPNITKSTAKSIADQILKAPTVKEGSMTVTEKVIQKAPSTRKLMEDLINTPTADLVRIQKKIAGREPKLAAKLDEVMNYREKIDFNQAAKQDLKEVTANFGDDPTTGKQIISGIIDGETFKLEVPPEVAKVMQGLGENKLDPVLKAVSIANKVFQTTWTGVLNPVFSGISFAFYDTPMSIINSPQGFKTLAPKAMVESIKSIRSSNEFQKNLTKAGAQTIGGSELGTFVRPTAEAIAARNSLLGRVKYSAKNPEALVNSLDVFGGKLAGATRTRVARAAYDAGIKRGMTKDAAMAEAAFAYNNIMPNFARMTPLVRSINAMIPFFSASVSGTRSLAQAMKRDPLGTTTKALAIGIAPPTALAAYSMSSQSGQDFYADMKASGRSYVLDNNAIVVLPGAHKDDKTGDWSGIIKIPLAPEMRSLNATAWRTVSGMAGQGGPSAMSTATALFDTVTGGVRTLENPYVDTAKIIAGQDPMTGERLVKGDMEDLPKSEQKYDSTSAAGSRIAALTGNRISPIQADKILGQFGDVGKTLKNGGHAGDAVAGDVKNRVSGASGESIADSFYKAYSPAQAQRSKVSKEVTELVKSGRNQEAKRKANEYNDTLADRFSPFLRQYKTSDQYDDKWDEQLDSLVIKTTGDAFEARRKQK